MIKIVNLKLVILLEYRNIKIFLEKITLQIGVKKLLWLKKIQKHCVMAMLLVILMEKNFWTVLRKRIAKNELKSSMALKCRSSSNKNMERKHLCCHDKNYCFFCKSNIPRTNLIVGSKNISQFQAKLTVFWNLSTKYKS